MRRYMWGVMAVGVLALALGMTVPALAQDNQPQTGDSNLIMYTDYPSQVIGVGDSPTLTLSLQARTTPEIVGLELKNVPQGWDVSLRGGGRVIESAYVQTTQVTTVQLRIAPPADVTPGDYTFDVVAHGTTGDVTLPITLTIQQKAPASLSFQVDLPTLRGNPSTTFRYSVTLRNDGSDDQTVNLTAQAPSSFQVGFSYSGQDVSSLPVEAGASKLLSVTVTPLDNAIPAGQYTITITAQGSEAQATTDLSAEIVGQSDISLTTSDGRLSGQAVAGKDTPFQLIVQNNGSAAAHNIKLTATQPNGWTVTFDTDTIDTLDAGTQVTVTATVHPADRALAGDYVVTFRAQPQDGSTQSVDYRVTVTTSTLWGVVGIALIAVAVVVVGLVVMRFGRR
jgi:uncharacterized membrane protein